MAVTALVLVGLDRSVTTRGLTRATAPIWPLICLGCGAAAAFTVRREGLAMVAAIAAAQLAALFADRGERWWRVDSGRNRIAARLLVPHLSALVVGLAGAGDASQHARAAATAARVSPTWGACSPEHVDHLAEVVGLKRPWEANPTVLGSVALGWLAVGLYLLRRRVVGIVWP